MATTLASLVVKIGADVTGVTAGMNTLDKRTRSLKAQFGSLKDSTLTWQGALGVLAGATGLAFAAKKAFDLGAAVEETASKFNTVFGPSVGGAQQFLDEFASTAGLTITKGRELLATTGAIAQGMGMSQAASASFAEEIVRLSADFASFNNVPIADTSKAIISALTGERESLKRLGIVINEADVQSRALAMTGKATAGALTQQEKATATLAIITERAGVAVGDLDRTMDSPANRARKLAADIMSLRDALAHALLPAFSVVLGELGKVAGSDGFTGLSQKVADSGGRIAAWAKFAVEAFKVVASAIAAPIRIAFNLGQALGELGNIVYNMVLGRFAEARAAAARMGDAFGDIDDAVGDVNEGFDRLRIASGTAWQTMATGEAVVAAAVAVTTELADETERLAQASIFAGIQSAQFAEDMRLAGDVTGRGIEIMLEMRSATEVYNETLRELKALLDATAISQQTYERASKAAAVALKKQTGETTKTDDVTKGMVSTISSGFADAVLSGQNFAQSIHQMAQQIIRDLVRVAIQGALMKAFLGGATGGVGFLGSLFGGGVGARAAGGPVSSGKPYVIGERGPELFVPRQSGAIVPNGGTAPSRGPSAGDIASAILGGLGPMPQAMTPDGVAAHRWYRQLFQAQLAFARHDGVRI